MKKHLPTIIISAIVALIVIFTIHVDIKSIHNSREQRNRQEQVYYEEQFFLIEKAIAVDCINEVQAEPMFRKLEDYHIKGLTMEFDAINEVRVFCPNFEGE